MGAIQPIITITMALNILLLLIPTISSAKDLGIDTRIPKLCLTKGERCVFPFKYKGKEYKSCTYADSPTPWCSTMVDSSGTAITNRWGDCDTSNCQVETSSLTQCTTIAGPQTNLPCIFPFKYQGVTYNSCTTASLGTPWCSTATYGDGS